MVETGGFHPFFVADPNNRFLAFARVGTGQPAACGEFTRNGDDPRGKTGASACFFEEKGHMRCVERGKTFQDGSPPISGEWIVT